MFPSSSRVVLLLLSLIAFPLLYSCTRNVLLLVCCCLLLQYFNTAVSVSFLYCSSVSLCLSLLLSVCLSLSVLTLTVVYIYIYTPCLSFIYYSLFLSPCRAGGLLFKYICLCLSVSFCCLSSSCFFLPFIKSISHSSFSSVSPFHLSPFLILFSYHLNVSFEHISFCFHFNGLSPPTVSWSSMLSSLLLALLRLLSSPLY